jgi:hypothetical protein
MLLQAVLKTGSLCERIEQRVSMRGLWSFCEEWGLQV